MNCAKKASLHFSSDEHFLNFMYTLAPLHYVECRIAFIEKPFHLLTYW